MGKKLNHADLTDRGYGWLKADLLDGVFGDGWEMYEAEEGRTLSQWVCNANPTFWVKRIDGGWRVVARPDDWEFLQLAEYAEIKN